MEKKIAELLREVEFGSETVLDVEKQEDGSKRVAFGLRTIPNPEPRIQRARARDHCFHEVDVFCRYLERVGDPDTTLVLADVGQSRIVAAINDEDESDRELVSFAAMPHPKLETWQSCLRSMPVLAFGQFLMENRRDIVEPDGRELAQMFSQLRASKSVTIQQGQGKRAVNGLTVEIEIMGERQGATVELPDSLEVKIPLFLASEMLSSICVDLLVVERNEQIEVIATAAELEEAKLGAFSDFVSQIQDRTGFLVGLGKVRERDWRHVPD